MFNDLNETELIDTNAGGLLGALAFITILILGSMVSCQNNCDCIDCQP